MSAGIRLHFRIPNRIKRQNKNIHIQIHIIDAHQCVQTHTLGFLLAMDNRARRRIQYVTKNNKLWIPFIDFFNVVNYIFVTCIYENTETMCIVFFLLLLSFKLSSQQPVLDLTFCVVQPSLCLSLLLIPKKKHIEISRVFELIKVPKSNAIAARTWAGIRYLWIFLVSQLIVSSNNCINYSVEVFHFAVICLRYKNKTWMIVIAVCWTCRVLYAPIGAYAQQCSLMIDSCEQNGAIKSARKEMSWKFCAPVGFSHKYCSGAGTCATFCNIKYLRSHLDWFRFDGEHQWEYKRSLLSAAIFSVMFSVWVSVCVWWNSTTVSNSVFVCVRVLVMRSI